MFIKLTRIFLFISILTVFLIQISFNTVHGQNTVNKDFANLKTYHNSLSAQETINRYCTTNSRSERHILQNGIFENREVFLPLISQTLITGSIDQKMSALALIRDMKDTNSAIIVNGLLTDQSNKVCIRAANVLGKLGNKNAITSFRQAISSPNISESFTQVLISNIGRSGSQEDIPLIRNYLNHPSQEISIYAAGSLAILGSIEGEEILLEGSRSENAWIQRISYFGLGLIKTVKSKTRLEEILVDGNASWKSYALLATRMHELDYSNYKHYLQQLVELAENSNRVISKWAISELVDITDENSIQYVNNLDIKHPSALRFAKYIMKARFNYGLQSIISDSLTDSRSNLQVLHATGVHWHLSRKSLDVLWSSFYTGHEIEIENGSYDEDIGFVFLLIPRSFRHAYNPYTGDGFIIQGIPQDNAKEESAVRWASALDDESFYLLGRTLHFIQDMTSPAHVHNDDHWDYEGSNPTNIDGFEKWGSSHINDSAYNYNYTNTSPIIPSSRTIGSFIDELAYFTYDYSSFYGIVEEDNTQPSSELKSMFPSLLFIEGGILTLWDDYWEIDGIGTFENAYQNDDWWVEDELSDYLYQNPGPNGVRRISGHFYIEQTFGDDISSESDDASPVYWHGSYNSNSKSMHELYAETLYKKAVQYGAGLLQVFYDEVNPGDPTFEITPSSRSVSSASGSTTFTMNSSVGWSVTDNVSWLTATKTSGSSIGVTYNENTSTSSRTATITATGTGGLIATATVVQSGASPTFEITPSSRSVSSASGSTTFTMNTTVGWDVTDNASWLIATKTGSSSIGVTFNENTSHSSRTATITATGTGGLVATATVVQSGTQPSLTVTSPNGGETWYRSNNYNITWFSSDAGSNVKIDLFGNAALNYLIHIKTIESSISNNGSYNWTVPLDLLTLDYKVKITSTSNSSVTDYSDNYFTITDDPLSTISEYDISLQQDLNIIEIFPNPFNSSTNIVYTVPRESNVMIEIYDICGKIISTLIDKSHFQGLHSVMWNGTNQHSDQVPAGLYLIMITLGNEVKTTKLMLLK